MRSLAGSMIFRYVIVAIPFRNSLMSLTLLLETLACPGEVETFSGEEEDDTGKMVPLTRYRFRKAPIPIRHESRDLSDALVTKFSQAEDRASVLDFIGHYGMPTIASWDPLAENYDQ